MELKLSESNGVISILIKCEAENKVENTTNEVVNNIVNEIDGNELTKITEEIGVVPEDLTR